VSTQFDDRGIMLVCVVGAQDVQGRMSVELAWIMPGTSSSTIFSQSGYTIRRPEKG